MSYEHRSNVGRKKVSAPLKIVTAASLFLFLLAVIAPQFLSGFFTAIARPFWGNTKEAGISAELRNAIIVELQKENIQLKAALHRTATTSSSSSDIVLAHILKKPPFSAYDIYIVDIGSDNGIKAGDKAYALGNVLLGEVAETNSRTSKVKLYSSFGEKYEVLIGKDIQATALGKGGGGFEVVLPRDVLIEEGDIVSVPDMDISVFGIVRKVIVDPAQAFFTVVFSQPVNIYEQRTVFIKKTK